MTTKEKSDTFENAIKRGCVEILKNFLNNDNRNLYIDAVIGDGFSKTRAIHLACDNGRSEIVRLLIENGCDKECENVNNLRPIHIACKKGHIDIVRVLIENKCNIECEDRNKLRPIHHASDNGFNNIVQLLIDSHCNTECEDKDKFRPIHYASSNGKTDIVRILIDTNCNIESENINKRRPIHYACYKGHKDIVQLLIKKGCQIDCVDQNKWRPIHFAGDKGFLEIIQLLVENDCDIGCLTENYESPLDLARKQNHRECVHFFKKYPKINNEIETLMKGNQIEELLEKISLFLDDDDTNFSVVQTVMNRNIKKLIELVTPRKMNAQEYNLLINLSTVANDETKYLIKENILYRCIRDNIVNNILDICSAEVVNRPYNLIMPSFLEYIVKYGKSMFLDKILKKTVYNKEIWTRAKHLAVERGRNKIADIITEREFVVLSRLNRNLSLLHTAVIDNDDDMVGYLLKEEIVDANQNHEVFGTALALAHSLCHGRCIQVLEQYNIDVNTQNKFGQTPLHEAITSGTLDQCQYLIERCSNIDIEGFNNLTALHCAVMEGCSDLCAQLTEYGADCTRIVNIQNGLEHVARNIMQTVLPITNHENALTLCLKINKTIYPCFQKQLDQRKLYCHDGSNNTLLHLAALCVQPDLCKLLLNEGALINARNNQENTCLLELLSYFDELKTKDIDQIINVLNILIEFGADINVKTQNGTNVFTLASKFDNEKLMMTLLSKSQNVVNITKYDFNLLFEKQWFQYLEVLIEVIPEEVISSFITRQIIMMCPTGLKPSLLRRVFDKAKKDVQHSAVAEILLNAALNDNEDLFDHFLDKEVPKANFCNIKKHLLSYLLKEKKLNFYWKLSGSKHYRYFVNLKNEAEQLPLQIAIEMDEMDIADHLLLDTNGINNRDKNGETALMQLLKKISMCNNVNIERSLIKTIRLVIREGGEIYMKTNEDKYIIDLCSKPALKRQIIDIFNVEKKNFERKKVVVVEKEISDKTICCVCLDREIEISLQCGHTLCTPCSNEIFKCPLCNREIVTRTKLYFNL